LNNVARAELLNWDLIDIAPDIKDTAKAWLVHLIESRAPLTAVRCSARVNTLRHSEA
jgi:hypothetical protein